MKLRATSAARNVLSWLAVYCIAALANAQRWYYTGNFNNERVTEQFFPGSLLDYDNIFQPESNGTFLYAGGLVLKLSSSNVTFMEDEEKFIHSLCMLKTEGELVDWSSLQSSIFNIIISHNYPPPPPSSPSSLDSEKREPGIPLLEAEVGLFDARIGEFLEKKWIDVTNGNITAAIVYSTHQSGDAEQPHYQIRHMIAYTSDLFGRRALVVHTWDRPENLHARSGGNVDSSRDLRIMTYNLWHNNPLSWVYTDKRKRWTRYDTRIRHFAEVVVLEDPDVITLQEVRLDSSFFSIAEDSSMPTWTAAPDYRKVDAGAQVEHLLQHLRDAQARLGLHSIDYQVLYQPAMFLFEKSRMAYRNEEGVLILSKYPIRSHQALFLPREVGNPQDDHQRMIVVAEIEVPDENGEDISISVGTTHLSLLERAREKSVESLLDFLDHNAHASRNSIQIFTGDLNAEPHEQSIQNIQGRRCDINRQTCTTSDREETGFVDSWVDANPHAPVENGLTFPACSPVKRIDYIFVRNHTCLSCHHKTIVTSSYITGTKPTADTEHLIGSREGLGMNDLDSPLWASDHFALVTDLKLFRDEAVANQAVEATAEDSA